MWPSRPKWVALLLVHLLGTATFLKGVPCIDFGFSTESVSPVFSTSEKYTCYTHKFISVISNHHHHHSPVRADVGGAWVDTAPANVLQLGLSSAFRTSASISRFVHSLMLKLQLFLCPPLILPPSRVPCMSVLDSVLWRMMWLNHLSFLLFTEAKRG